MWIDKLYNNCLNYLNNNHDVYLISSNSNSLDFAFVTLVNHDDIPHKFNVRINPCARKNYGESQLEWSFSHFEKHHDIPLNELIHLDYYPRIFLDVEKFKRYTESLSALAKIIKEIDDNLYHILKSTHED